MNSIAYLVVESGYDGGGETKRVYADRAEAEAFVQAYNQSGGFVELEEMPVGAPQAEYDGPVYIATWTTRRKFAGEKQLVIVGEDGLTTVVPSAVPAGAGTYHYREMFAPGPSWRELSALPDYEEPAVWIDNFYESQKWHTGDMPPVAEVTERGESVVEVRGTDKVAVERMCRETAVLQASTVRGPL